MRSAPAASASATCWPRRAKSEARIEGASLIGRFSELVTRWFSILVVYLRTLFARAIAADKGVGRAVVRKFGIGRTLQFGCDAVGEDFAELDAPLIERVHAPDHALDENGMLIEGDDLAECGRSEAVEQERVGRAISFKCFVRHERFGDFFGPHFVGGFSKSECLGLCKD